MLNPDLTKSLEQFMEISVETATWRSLYYARRVRTRDLAPLPSEISTLGCFQEDVEEYLGVYVSDVVTKDVRYAADVTEDMNADRSNRGIIAGLQEHGGRPHRPIDHRLWDIPTNVPGTFVYLVYPYDPGSFQSHIPLHHPQI